MRASPRGGEDSGHLMRVFIQGWEDSAENSAS
jgi:hypothetical protein